MASSKKEEESLTLTTDNVTSSHKRKREDPAEESDEQTAGRPQPRQPEHTQHLTPQMSYFQTFQTSAQYGLFQSTPQQSLGYQLPSLLPQPQKYVNFPHSQQQQMPYIRLVDVAPRHPVTHPLISTLPRVQPSSHTRSDISQSGAIVSRDPQVHSTEITQNHGKTREHFHLWDKRNPKEWTPMSKQKDFLRRIKQNFTYLTSALDPSLLWPILHETRAVDEEIQERIELNSTRKVQVQKLMEYIGRGPTAQFHAFLRACALTNQEHIIRELGLEPDDYGEAAAPSGIQRWRRQAPFTVTRGYQGQLPFPQSAAILPPYEQSMGHQVLPLSNQPTGHFMLPVTSNQATNQPAILPFQQHTGHCMLPMTGNQATNRSVMLPFQQPPAVFHIQSPPEQPSEGLQLNDQAEKPQSQQKDVAKGEVQHPTFQAAGHKGVQSQGFPQYDSDNSTPNLFRIDVASSGQKHARPVSATESTQSQNPRLHSKSGQKSQSLISVTPQKSPAQLETQSNCMDTPIEKRLKKGQEKPASTTYQENANLTSAMKYKLSKRLEKAIIRHSEGCRRNLMMRKVFDFKEDDRGDVINTAKCYIQLQVNMKDHMITLELPEEDIFEKIQMQDPHGETTYQQDAPQGVRLYGPPGAGKTTFLRHIVHAWSIDFLEKGPEKWTTMVYIPARDIRSTIKDAIKDHLWCSKKDEGILMKHVEGGEGVAIAIDAVDEIRDNVVLHNLQDYVHMRQTRGGPKILISARNDLCRIDPQDFSRFLILEGFSSEQGLLYMKQYFAMGKPLPIHQRALDYANRHKDKMEAVLQNPLKLHIFCALTEKGILELGEEFKFEILNLFEPLEKYLTTREGGSVTEEQSKNFYKLCLFALLSGMRDFTKSILTQFKIVKNYYAFLVKEDTRDKDAKLTARYSFTHEMIFEYFASRYIENMELEGLRSLLLSVCCKKTLRNVQKIMFEIIHHKELHKEELLTLTIRCIIILQPLATKRKQNKTIEKLMNLPKQIKSSISIRQLVLSRQDRKQIKDAKTVIQEINKAFDKHVQALRDFSWFHGLELQRTINHLVDCLQVCNPQQREKIIATSLHCLLPCEYKDDDRNVTTIYPVNHARWGKVAESDEGMIELHAWCIADVQDLLKADKEANPQLLVLGSNILIDKYSNLWGVPGDSYWTQEAWTNLLQDVVDFLVITVMIPFTSPLTGLFQCVAEGTFKFEVFTIGDGTASLAEVEACAQGIQKHGKNINLRNTHVVMPSDQEEGALRARRDKLDEIVDKKGERIVRYPEWRAEDGTKFLWSDC